MKHLPSSASILLLCVALLSACASGAAPASGPREHGVLQLRAGLPMVPGIALFMRHLTLDEMRAALGDISCWNSGVPCNVFDLDDRTCPMRQSAPPGG